MHYFNLQDNQPQRPNLPMPQPDIVPLPEKDPGQKPPIHNPPPDITPPTMPPSNPPLPPEVPQPGPDSIPLDPPQHPQSDAPVMTI